MNSEVGAAFQNAPCIEEAIEHGKKRTDRPLVVIRCLTYCQQEYVAQCLEGFVSQKTNFPFVAIVHDDASGDATPEIIREYAARYPDVIHAVCDTKNRYTEHTLARVMDALVAAYQPKYIAFCEGDDYWSDPLKLQKQVDYLDSHPDCVMCHGDYDVLNGTKKKVLPHHDDEPFFGPGHLHAYPIANLTVLYRYDVYQRIPHYAYTKQWLMGDYPLWIEMSREGKFHFMNEVFGVYRILPNSASHSTDGERIKRFWECKNEITKFYSELYGYDYTESSRKSLYRMIQTQCYENRDREQAKRYWREAKSCKATDLKSFLFYFCNVYRQRWIMNTVYKIIG